MAVLGDLRLGPFIQGLSTNGNGRLTMFVGNVLAYWGTEEAVVGWAVFPGTGAAGLANARHACVRYQRAKLTPDDMRTALLELYGIDLDLFWCG